MRVLLRVWQKGTRDACVLLGLQCCFVWCIFGFVFFTLPVDDTITSECVTSSADIRDIAATVLRTVWDKVCAVCIATCQDLTVIFRTENACPRRQGLLRAIETGDLAVVHHLVCHHNVTVNQLQRHLPILYAAKRGHLDIVKFLVERGALIDFTERRVTPLHLAACHGHFEVMKYLVSVGAQLDSEDEDWATPLHHAAFGGGLIAVAYLWRLYQERLDDVQCFLVGREKTDTDDQFNTVLDWAIQGGNLTVVQFLIQQGASLDGRSYPLHRACLYHQTAIVRYLISFGVDVRRCEPLCTHSRTALQCVFEEPKQHRRRLDQHDLIDVVQMLVERGSDVNVRWQDDGQSILHIVVERQRVGKLLLYLLQKGADPNVLDHKKRSPLHDAAHSAQNIRLLLEHGADVNVSDALGDTPLHDAAYYVSGWGSCEALAALLQHGADAYKLNDSGMTPLLYLLFGRDRTEEGVRYLLRWGVALNIDEQRKLAEREKNNPELEEGTYMGIIEQAREKVAETYSEMEQILLRGARESGPSILPDDIQRLLISFIVTGTYRA